MAVPWLRIIDAALGVTDLVRGRRSPSSRALAETDLPLGGGAGGPLGHLETRLAGVVVAALKEAFDRDSRRLDLEREHVDAERRRAELALKLEVLRQAGEREIGRLRLLAGAAIASWIGTLFFSGRLAGAGVPVRVTLGFGWVLLLAAIATAFVAQSRVGDLLSRADDKTRAEDVSSGAAGAVAPWLIVAGLALVGASVLIA